MSKVLVDRELLAGVCSMVPEKMKAARKELRAILAQPEDPEGFEIARHSKRLVDQLRSDLSAVTAERDRLRDAAGKAIAWLDAEQNGSGVGINRRLKLCRDAENSLRAAMAAKEA
ncbi:hypothetical protein ACX1DW_01415 [Stutzerimonas sp. KH-1]|jgi:hypothetical protein